MRRNTYFAIAMMFAMATANTYAQRHEGHNRNDNHAAREFSMRDRSFHGNRENGYRSERNNERRNDYANHAERRNDYSSRNEHHNNNGFRLERHDNHAYRNEHHDVREHAHHAGRPVIADHHFHGRFDHRGHVIGWEGRVRHENGRWGYYRDNRWYWYNRYFEPTYYFGNPIHHFNDYYYLTDGCYVPGYDGRVCYSGGRWGYYRNNDWYWYDRYYEPDYYYSHPIHHFHHTHVGHVAHKVAAGVAGTIVLGALISALCH